MRPIIAKIAFVIYDGMTTLDFVGAFEPLTKMKTMGLVPKLGWDVCSFKERVVRDQDGLRLIADKVGTSLGGYDLVVVPGGPGNRILLNNSGFINWIRTSEKAKLRVSICTGSLLFGAAGFLKDRKATTHHSAYKLLANYCPRVVKGERIVDEGDIITAGGISASIDLGLYLCEKFLGRTARNKIQRQMEYFSNLGKLAR
jgi:transcriptional regulator GlxA family with amidase domain